MGGSLPRLMKLYDTYADRRDRFEILAFHDATAKTFEELDEKLERTVRVRWEGRNLPFPVLLDSSGTTVRRFGIRAYPTHVLIDPQGRLVKGDERTFERIVREELAPPPEETPAGQDH